MREARDRIHLRRDVIKCLAPCAGPTPCAGPSANPAPEAKSSASAAPATPRSSHPASGPGSGSSRRPARPPPVGAIGAAIGGLDSDYPWREAGLFVLCTLHLRTPNSRVVWFVAGLRTADRTAHIGT
jgi:hypothetical protein